MMPDDLRQSRGLIPRFCGADDLIIIVPLDTSLQEAEWATSWMAVEYVDVICRAVALEQVPMLRQASRLN